MKKEISFFIAIILISIVIVSKIFAQTSIKNIVGSKNIYIVRFKQNPIISQELNPFIGNNINNLFLIKVALWLPIPLGKYYLYNAHHNGKYIYLANAENLEGPLITSKSDTSKGLFS